MTQITPAELIALRGKDTSVVLLDVRLPEDFEEGHLEGAVNNCVFEVAFMERMAGLTGDKQTPVVVYGAEDSSHESRVAAEKLERAGYTKVYDLRCGLRGCEEVPVTKGAARAAEPGAPNGTVKMDLKESRVQWTGRNLINKHTGKLPLKSGELVFDHGRLTGGEFVLDMEGVTCDDLAGGPMHEVLIAHLKSDDFFDVERFPEAVLHIDEAVPTESARPGAPNLKVNARLTLRGVTVPIEFTATTGLTDQGKPAAQAAFAIDRTKWGVLYGSGGFFHRLAGHLVNDLIEVEIRVVGA